MGIFASRFAGLSQLYARLILAALVLAVLAGLAVSFSGGPVADAAAGESRGDRALYQGIVERVRGGENYYAAAADELRTNGYALKPVFNFRLPTLASVLAALPVWAGQMMLGLLSAGTLAAWIVKFRKAGVNLPRTAAVGAVLFTGVGTAFAGSALVFHEVWAGLFVALSLGLYGGVRDEVRGGVHGWVWAVVCGLCAVLVRELALPLPVVMMVLAVREKRMVEAGAWLGVLVVFGVFFGVHAVQANAQVQVVDAQNGWASVGGLGFVLSTVRWNAMLLAAPMWVSAALLPLAVLGLAGWKSALGLRVAVVVALWLAAFMVVGRPDNDYWGLMYAPLLALGAALCVPSLVALVKAAMPLQRQAATA